MNLSTIFNSITSIFKSADISDVLIATRDRLRDATIPAVATCIEDTKTVSFKNNPEYNTALSTVKRHYPKTNNLELFQAFGLIVSSSEKLLNDIIPLIDQYFTATVDKDSITYPRAQIMALAETCDFVGTFIPRYCRFIIAKQTEVSGGNKVEQLLSRAQIKYIKENTLDFYKAIDTLGKASLKDIKTLLKEIPDVRGTEDGSENNLFNKNKLDPTGAMNRFTTTLNPIYFGQMAWVDYQHDKYKQAKEEVEAIKIDLDYMNSQIQNGTGDAYVERQKELAQERLDKLEYRIAKHEEKAHATIY